MKSAPILLAAALLGTAAAAEPPQRATTAVVYGDDPCPTSSDPEEIVVCARRPEGDRYRIPKELRNVDDPPSETSWGSRAEAAEEAGRSVLPGSCNPVGSYGQTGCRQQMLNNWYRERAERRRRED